MRLRTPRTAFILLASITLMAFAACGTEESNSAPAQVPSAPEPVLPLNFDGVEDVDSFLAALPPSESACLTNSSLGFLLTAEDPGQAMLESDLFGGIFGEDMFLTGTPTPEQFVDVVEEALTMAQEAVECVSDDTIKGAIAGGIVLATEVELSQPTLQCMGEGWAGIDFQQMILDSLDQYEPEMFAQVLEIDSPAGGDFSQFTPEMIEESLDLLYGTVPAVFCINEEEREAMGEAGDALDVAECGFNAFERDEVGELLLAFGTWSEELDTMNPESLDSLDSLFDFPPEFTAAIGTFMSECSSVLAESGMFDADDAGDIDDLLSQLELLGGDETSPELQDLLEGIQPE